MKTYQKILIGLGVFLIILGGYFVISHIQDKTPVEQIETEPIEVETEPIEQTQITPELQNLINQQEYLANQIEQLKSEQQSSQALIDSIYQQNEINEQANNEISSEGQNELAEVEKAIEKIKLQILDALTSQKIEEEMSAEKKEQIRIDQEIFHISK